MKVTLESTTKIVRLQINGADVPARIWEGETDSGIAVHAFITRIGVHEDDDATQFEAELVDCREPRFADVAAYPLRLFID